MSESQPQKTGELEPQTPEELMWPLELSELNPESIDILLRLNDSELKQLAEIVGLEFEDAEKCKTFEVFYALALNKPSEVQEALESANAFDEEYTGGPQPNIHWWPADPAIGSTSTSAPFKFRGDRKLAVNIVEITTSGELSIVLTSDEEAINSGRNLMSALRSIYEELSSKKGIEAHLPPTI